MAAIRLAVRCFRKAGVEARSVMGAGTPTQGSEPRGMGNKLCLQGSTCMSLLSSDSNYL
jgi:hypothetical protein